MYKKILFLILISFSIIAQKSPKEFLGYDLGSEFTYHHLFVDYAKHIASTNPLNIQWVSYGKTSERRELGQLIITSPGLQNRLSEILNNHLNFISGKKSFNNDVSNLPVIINLSFNVHGNEAAGSEAAIGLMYNLAKNYQDLIEWSNSKPFVIMIDPCINPDGRETYAIQFNRKNYFKGGNEDPNDQEHFEGKISGRYNHFLHDLNRDWAWHTQIETQQRIKFYQSFMPMLHADFHEQSGQHSYYFPPAAKPYLNFISEGTKELQQSVGKSFSKLFDENGWTYFTSEVYDLLYPSYGDTYPILNGALAMTLEQGGIRAGLSQKLLNGDTLRFGDRVKHHRLLANNLVKWSLVNQDKVKNTFYKNHEIARTNPSNLFKTYVIPKNQIKKAEKLLHQLKNNRIEYGYPDKEISSATAYSYVENKNVLYKVTTDDIVISAYQSASPMAQVLLDPSVVLEDSLTYDITAWNLFQLHGVNAFGLKEKISPKVEISFVGNKNVINENALGFYLKPNNSKEIQFIDKVYHLGFDVVFNDISLENNGKVIEAGTFFIFSKNKKNNFQNLINEANLFSIELNSFSSFRFEKGADLGSEHFKFYKSPKPVVLVGEDFDVNQIGELANFFVNNLNIKTSFVPTQEFFNKPNDHYTHLIIPSNNSYLLKDQESDILLKWINSGGNLVLFENALNSLPITKFSFTKNYNQLKDSVDLKPAYNSRERNELSKGLGGNLLELKAEISHPFLARNVNENSFILNTSNTLYSNNKELNSLLYTSLNPKINGFMGSKMKRVIGNTTWMTTIELGKGKLTWFNFNPLFRSIPTIGQTIFENMLLYHTY
ncbi:MAG: hypothetical protein RJA76_1818 [Bacteroidota bacterium]|jgi:hypothetical protein